MKLILNKNCVKREIEGPFELCVSEADARRLIVQLQDRLDHGFSYGWITIYDEPKVIGQPNGKPLPWV